KAMATSLRFYCTPAIQRVRSQPGSCSRSFSPRFPTSPPLILVWLMSWETGGPMPSASWSRSSAATRVMLAAAYAAVGRQQAVERAAKGDRQRFPTLSRVQFGSGLRDPSLRVKLDHALEMAGL